MDESIDRSIISPSCPTCNLRLLLSNWLKESTLFTKSCTTPWSVARTPGWVISLLTRSEEAELLYFQAGICNSKLFMPATTTTKNKQSNIGLIRKGRQSESLKSRFRSFACLRAPLQRVWRVEPTNCSRISKPSGSWSCPGKALFFITQLRFDSELQSRALLGGPSLLKSLMDLETKSYSIDHSIHSTSWPLAAVGSDNRKLK